MFAGETSIEAFNINQLFVDNNPNGINITNQANVSIQGNLLLPPSFMITLSYNNVNVQGYNYNLQYTADGGHLFFINNVNVNIKNISLVGSTPSYFIHPNSIGNSNNIIFDNCHQRTSNVFTTAPDTDWGRFTFKNLFVWGNPNFGGSNPPSDLGYMSIYSNDKAFAGIKLDGSISTWGDSSYGGSDTISSDKDFVRIFSTSKAFAALKNDGSVFVWGDNDYGGNQESVSSLQDVNTIFSNDRAFAAIKNDGSIFVWGDPSYGGSNDENTVYYTRKPFSSNPFVNIVSNDKAFTAIDSAGHICS